MMAGRPGGHGDAGRPGVRRGRQGADRGDLHFGRLKLGDRDVLESQRRPVGPCPRCDPADRRATRSRPIAGASRLVAGHEWLIGQGGIMDRPRGHADAGRSLPGRHGQACSGGGGVRIEGTTPCRGAEALAHDDQADHRDCGGMHGDRPGHREPRRGCTVNVNTMFGVVAVLTTSSLPRIECIGDMLRGRPGLELRPLRAEASEPLQPGGQISSSSRPLVCLRPLQSLGRE
jgi:hypothetical protein